jgi:hypothetical protein
MTSIILLNLVFVAAAVAALAAVCRIPYRLHRADDHLAGVEVLYELEEERRAA